MVLAIIFLLVAIVCVFGVFRSFKNRNFLAIFFSGASVLLFGWFSIRRNACLYSSSSSIISPSLKS